jgi:hypothetical protein
MRLVHALSGPSAVEMHVGSRPGDTRDRVAEFTQKSPTTHRLSYHSLHLPALKRIPQDQLAQHVQGWRRLVEERSITTLVLHPEQGTLPHIEFITREFSSVHSARVAAENMDSRKDNSPWQQAHDVGAYLRRTNLPLVLDLQHAWEVSGRSMAPFKKLLADLIREAQAVQGIAQLHVSGEIFRNGKQEVNHASLLAATNREEIFQGLCFVRDTLGEGKLRPIILEGDPYFDLPREVRAQSIHAEGMADVLASLSTRFRKEIHLVREALFRHDFCASESAILNA